MEPPDFPAVPERAEENHDFSGEIGKTWETDCREYAKSERQPSERHHPRKAAELIKGQRGRSPAQFACDAK